MHPIEGRQHGASGVWPGAFGFDDEPWDPLELDPLDSDFPDYDVPIPT